MSKNRSGSPRLEKTDWLIAGIFGIAAAVTYFASLANFAYPGESAHLMALWRGLDVAKITPYPLMAYFTGLLGGGNAIAAVSGTLSVVCVCLLTTFFVRRRINGEHMQQFSVPASRLAGVVAAAIFMFTPAVRSAATHLEPRMFDAAWMLLALSLVLPWSRASSLWGALLAVAFGMMWGLGFADSVLFAVLVPFALVVTALMALGRGRKPYFELLLFLLSFVVAFFVMASAGTGDLVETLRSLWEQFGGYRESEGWMMVLFFSTIPFFVALFSSNKAYNEESGWVQWTFHISMGICSVLAIATPLSPSSMMEQSGVLPVATSVFAAFVAGYLAAYWLLVALAAVRVNESKDVAPVAKMGRFFAYVVGGMLSVVYVFTLLFNLFMFDSERGAFADRLAARAIDDLGDREWFVTDGTLDDHLRLVAAAKGKTLNVVSLSRDLDKDYLDDLAKLVKEKSLGGERNPDLLLSLQLGILQFVQDWFAADPAAAKGVAIFGAPDLWYSSGITPVPEFMFFGADPGRKTDWSAWSEMSKTLEAPEGWGSYRLWKIKNPVERKRLELRRHFGFVANNYGVWLQDQGRNEEAYAMYEMVLDSIDRDNICALFNAFELAQVKDSKAASRRHDFEKRLKAIVDDPARRYRLWSLSTYYGYIRKPEMLIRLGFMWARSGRPGEALAQIRRAVDFIPTDKRTALMNMMAALYANENDRAKSREVYEKVLQGNASDHDALIGMMRLSLLDGDETKALTYLERATVAGGDDPRIKIELAMLALMKQDLDKAKELLKQVTDADATDLRAWSLLAAVTMQQIDASKDDKAVRAKLEAELSDSILPTMEKQSRGPNDYYVQTTRAFLLLRQGADKRREARDAFAAAARERPDVIATQDLVMGLDISLDDVESAERHARDVLRRNRNSPLANYVMGSISLRRNDNDAAERYLRKAADAQRPVVLAMNDLAEVLRRTKRFDEAERYARMAVKTDPRLYVAWETIGAILMDANGDLEEAQRCIEKACELSKKKDGRNEDIRMLISLARVQKMKGDVKMARVTLRKVQSRVGELSEFEKGEYDELMKNVR